MQWLTFLFLQDPEIKELSSHAPGLINSLTQKLESLYLETQARDPNDDTLHSIVTIIHKALDMKAELLGEVAIPHDDNAFSYS